VQEETPIPQQLEPISPDQVEVPDLVLGLQEPLRQYCVFRAGRERFCLSVLEVEEVVDWPPLTRMPTGADRPWNRTT